MSTPSNQPKAKRHFLKEEFRHSQGIAYYFTGGITVHRTRTDGVYEDFCSVSEHECWCEGLYDCIESSLASRQFGVDDIVNLWQRMNPNLPHEVHYISMEDLKTIS